MISLGRRWIFKEEETIEEQRQRRRSHRIHEIPIVLDTMLLTEHYSQITYLKPASAKLQASSALLATLTVNSSFAGALNIASSKSIKQGFLNVL